MSVSDGDASSKNGISSPGHVLSSKRDSPVTISHSTTPPPTIPSGRQDRQRSRVSKVLQESSAISSPEQEGSEIKSIFGGELFSFKFKIISLLLHFTVIFLC